MFIALPRSRLPFLAETGRVFSLSDKEMEMMKEGKPNNDNFLMEYFLHPFSGLFTIPGELLPTAPTAPTVPTEPIIPLNRLVHISMAAASRWGLLLPHPGEESFTKEKSSYSDPDNYSMMDYILCCMSARAHKCE